MVNSLFHEELADETYNELTKNTYRTENCFSLEESLVNTGVWSVMKPQTQTEASKIRRIQNAIIKAICYLAKFLHKEAASFDMEMVRS